MRVTVSPERLEASPRAPQPVAITITNVGSVIGGYQVRLLGADPTWVELDDERISLFPDESRTLTATITLPEGLAAGERRMAVQVRELTPPERSTVEELVLVVPEAPSTQVRVDPPTQSVGRTGRFSLLIDNNGNTPARGWLAGDDAERKLRYRFDPPTVELAPGESAVVDMRVRGRRPFVGQPALRSLSLHLVDGPLPGTGFRSGRAATAGSREPAGRDRGDGAVGRRLPRPDRARRSPRRADGLRTGDHDRAVADRRPVGGRPQPRPRDRGGRRLRGQRGQLRGHRDRPPADDRPSPRRCDGERLRRR
ncbi:hypothetical protein [Nocardioides sp. TF02-7]|uniref:COG1470 family protein n=1 Tax=Nocardioides sp. TF02-7 TaxID=2917724 RepID=UPI001F05CBB3|nr:hypothetical protein [Nocardioides sp. TF02-7]UMG91032.1 hypothetical protein MF408_12430 [Nocardioides sp. TF02-7]